MQFTVPGRMEAAERVEVEMCRALGGLAPARLLEVGSTVAFAMPVLPDVRMMNRAVGITAHTTDNQLDELETFFHDLGVLYQLVPAEPGLEGRLAERGLVSGYAWMKFTRGIEDGLAARTDLRVERVDGRHADDYARVVRETWSFPEELHDWLAATTRLPGWACYLTWADDEPAGAAALYVSGDTGWLGFGSTLPAFRGRGSQSALFAARIKDASVRGARLVVTETGAAGEDGPGASYRNILRAGFEETYLRPNFERP